MEKVIIKSGLTKEELKRMHEVMPDVIKIAPINGVKRVPLLIVTRVNLMRSSSEKESIKLTVNDFLIKQSSIQNAYLIVFIDEDLKQYVLKDRLDIQYGSVDKRKLKK